MIIDHSWTFQLIEYLSWMHEPDKKLMALHLQHNGQNRYRVEADVDRRVTRVLEYTRMLGVAKNVSDPETISQIEHWLGQAQLGDPLWPDD